MNENNNFALVRKSSSAIEKAAPGAKRILSGMVAETLLLAKKESLLKIVHVEYRSDWLFEMLGSAIHMKYKNVAIKTFMDGDLAWQEILQNEPDLLITTLVREKGLNGYDMISRLATRKAKFPILVYDGLMDKGGEEHVRRLAGQDLKTLCLYCPFTTEQFYNALSDLFGHK